MAVQQNKKSPSKRGMHRSQVHLRHHISPNGVYRGKKVLKTKGD